MIIVVILIFIRKQNYNVTEMTENVFKRILKLVIETITF